MIGYVTLGSNDLERSAAFYDAVLSVIGAKRSNFSERMLMWRTEAGGPMLGVCIPFDESRATSGNGTMVALNVDSKETVNGLHAKAMESGGSTEGDPGPRGEGGFSGGYFRDLDGNKIAVFTIGG